MKKIAILIILFMVLTISSVCAFAGGSGRDKVPSVPQLSPDDEVTIRKIGVRSRHSSNEGAYCQFRGRGPELGKNGVRRVLKNSETICL